MKRSICIFCCLLTLLSAFTACSGGGDGGAITTAAAAGEVTTAAETEDPALRLTVEKSNYNGRKFTLLANEYISYEYGHMEQTGEIVDDAVYTRNVEVEDYLGIKFNFVYQKGNWNERDDFTKTITQTVLAGDSTYDLVSGTTVCTMPVSNTGCFLEVGSLAYLDLDKPWWIADMYDRFSVNGILYGVIGDSSLSLYKDLSVIYFNVNKLNSNKLDNLYTLVREDKWVLDKFIETGLSVRGDLDGNGKMEIDKDELGFLAEAVPNGTFQTALELPIISVKGGKVEYLGLSEKFIKAYEKLYDFNVDSDTTFSISTIDDSSFKTMKYFAEGRVLLMANFIYSTEKLRDMEDDYGIVPYPKYDENQEKYLAQLGTSTQMLFVPKTAADPGMTSKTMECLSYYSYNDVSPLYYDVALKEKYARDDDMHEMLDIIRQGATFDFLFVYGTSLSGAMNNSFRFNTGGSFTRDIASTFASKEAQFKQSLESWQKAYADNEAAG